MGKDLVRNPTVGRPYKNKLPPSDYFKTNILIDCMGFNPIGLRAAVEMCGVDRVVFAPITVRCLTESRSMSGSSRACFRARLSANRCSGRLVTEYSAWAYSIPISSPIKSSVERLVFNWLPKP